MQERDLLLDRLRGFAMLWVIVVHVFYWGGVLILFPVNVLKSFCLWEMPLFFFVAGAGNGKSRPIGYGRFVLKRLTRVMIPYWVYACFCIALTLLQAGVHHTLGEMAVFPMILSWLLPFGTPITGVPYLTYIVWFIPVYLAVMLLFPLLRMGRRSRLKIPLLLILPALFVLTCLTEIDLLREIAFYTIWAYVGLFYDRIKAAVLTEKRRGIFLAGAAGGAAAVLLFSVAGYPFDMQVNKFPPNLMFLAYSCMAMSVLILAFPLINGVFAWAERVRGLRWVVSLYTTRSMTLFLYQTFVFLVLVRVGRALLPAPGLPMECVRAVLYLLVAVPACAVPAWLFGRLEEIRIKF